MQVQEIAPGLWRWTGLHPDWCEGDEWEQEVGCIYYEAPDAIVLIDPLVPPEDADHFWTALDRDVERIGHEVVVLLTVPSHERSASEIAGRYGARIDGAMPKGVEPVELPGAGGEPETLYWIPKHGALVAGDVLLGDPLRVCPDSRLPTELRGQGIRRALRALLDLPVERVLPAHGEPVLEDGLAALERLLAS